MGTWPLVIIKFKSKNFRIEQKLNLHSHVHDAWQILLEQVRAGIIVLVFHDILDDAINSSNLIILQGIVNGIPVEKLVRSSLFGLHPVKDWILGRKVLTEAVVKKESHRLAIK